MLIIAQLQRHTYFYFGARSQSGAVTGPGGRERDRLSPAEINTANCRHSYGCTCCMSDKYRCQKTNAIAASREARETAVCPR